MARKAKQKFQEQREQEVALNPLRPLTKKQGAYIDLVDTKVVVVATGYAGTSKTYIPTVMAADAYRTGEINQIIFCRPAISNSKSLGYFSGSVVEKMQAWLTPVISILKSRLGDGVLEIALKRGDIVYQPLETIKGCSFENAWIIVDEAEDLTWDEVQKVITRVGNSSKLIFAGDITQSELKESSGLKYLKDFSTRHDLGSDFGFIDFDQTSDIVRSDAVRSFIVALHRDKKETPCKR